MIPASHLKSGNELQSVESFIHIEMGNQDNRLPSSSVIPWFTLHNDYSKLLPREHFCRKSKWMSIYPFMNETVSKHCSALVVTIKKHVFHHKWHYNYSFFNTTNLFAVAWSNFKGLRKKLFLLHQLQPS